MTLCPAPIRDRSIAEDAFWKKWGAGFQMSRDLDALVDTERAAAAADARRDERERIYKALQNAGFDLDTRFWVAMAEAGKLAPPPPAAPGRSRGWIVARDQFYPESHDSLELPDAGNRIARLIDAERAAAAEEALKGLVSDFDWRRTSIRTDEIRRAISERLAAIDGARKGKGLTP